MLPVPLIGRADELSQLVLAWSRVVTNPSAGPQTAVVTGPAGAGKSRLVATALETFDPRPDAVLFGRARLHSPAPYDWLAALLSAQDTVDLPIPRDALAWLAQEPGSPARRYAPDALLRLAVRTVRALAGAGPTVIVVEDLHALDAASLNLIAELTTAPGLPALLLVASRPPENAVNPKLVGEALTRLAGTPGAIRQRLAPLATGPDADSASLRAARAHLAAGLPETALHAVRVGLRTGEAAVPLLRIGVTAAVAAARFEEAASYATAWLALAPADDPLDRAAAHRELAVAAGRLNRGDECAAQLAAARDLLAEARAEGGTEWARYLAALAETELDGGRPAGAAETARRALAVADVDPTASAAASVTLAGALAELGEPEPGLALLRTARRTAAERRDLATLGRAVDCLVARHLHHLDESAAWYAFDEAVATATRFGLEQNAGRAIVAGVRLAVRVGNADRARELATARLPLEPDAAMRAILAAAAGALAVEAGDLAAASDLADRADQDAARAEAPSAIAAAAVLHVALGGPIEEYASRVPAAYDRLDPGPFLEAARRTLATGAPWQTVRSLRRERLEPDGRRTRADAQLRCALLAAEGRDKAAVDAGLSGLEGRPVAAWLDADTHLTVARCLARLGRPAEARSHAELAAGLLTRWPGSLRARVAELRTSLASSLAAGAELTAREVEVLGCLAAGMSNKQVARSLGISVRTVGVHVSNLLRKTRSASRTEAALWAVRHRLADASAPIPAPDPAPVPTLDSVDHGLVVVET
ncbi:MAG TPA: AAA family ATPase [Micromonosporaceae bacterium]|jgi:DNA-binding CsgD family transcriptional regulator